MTSLLIFLLFLLALILIICGLYNLSSTPVSSIPLDIPDNKVHTLNISPLKEAPFPCYLMTSDDESKYLTDKDGIFTLTDRIEDATMYTYHRGDGDFLKAKGYQNAISKYWDEMYANQVDFLEGSDYLIELEYTGPYKAHAIIRTLVQDPSNNLYLIVKDTKVEIQHNPDFKTIFNIPNYIYNYEF